MPLLRRFLRTFFPLSGEIGHGVFYRRTWRYFLGVIVLWLLFMFIQWQPLGFIAFAASGLGAVSALMLAARTRGFPSIWFDRERQTFRHDADDMSVSDNERPDHGATKRDVVTNGHGDRKD